ncbi:putative nucleotidyltransferase, ribonuclease H [Tanacetum coccineum]
MTGEICANIQNIDRDRVSLLMTMAILWKRKVSKHENCSDYTVLHQRSCQIVLTRFTFVSGKVVQKAWGTRLMVCTAFHPETVRTVGGTIQTFERYVKVYVLRWAGNWGMTIYVSGVCYNNSWHASIKCAPFRDVVMKKVKEAQTRQTGVTRQHARALEFRQGEHVLLKVSTTRWSSGVLVSRASFSPRFLEQFEILDR